MNNTLHTQAVVRLTCEKRIFGGKFPFTIYEYVGYDKEDNRLTVCFFAASMDLVPEMLPDLFVDAPVIEKQNEISET